MDIPAKPPVSISNSTKRLSSFTVIFLAFIGNNSLPETLKTKGLRSESRMARADFYSGLDEIHDPQRTPHVDLRTMNNIVGETVLLKTIENKDSDVNVVTLEQIRSTLGAYDIPVSMINDALQAIKIRLRTSIKDSDIAISVKDISEDITKMKALSDEELEKLIIEYEGLSKTPKELIPKIIAQVKPSYEQLLRVDYI